MNEQQRVELLEELLNPFPQLMAFVAIAFAAVIHGLTDTIWTAVAAVGLTAIVLGLRVIVSRQFKRSRHDPRWVYGFVAATLMTASGWGIASFLLFVDADARTKIAVLAAICAIIQGVAARAYSMPGAAISNIAIVLTAVSCAAIYERWYFMVVGCAIYLVFLISFVQLMVKLRLRQLRAERTTGDLLREIQEKNTLLNEANARLAQYALHDSLTKLANRRLFDKTLSDQLRHAAENRSCVSLLLIDVDHFKRFNDTYGHQSGDRCLQLIADALNRWGPQGSGLVARYGGEEFAVILPDSHHVEARVVAERIRLAVSLQDLSHLPGSPPRQSVSIGIASVAPGDGLSDESLLRRADKALYDAKWKGRNRVQVFVAEEAARREGIVSKVV